MQNAKTQLTFSHNCRNYAIKCKQKTRACPAVDIWDNTMKAERKNPATPVGVSHPRSERNRLRTETNDSKSNLRIIEKPKKINIILCLR